MSKAQTRAQERAERAAAALAEQRRKERRRTTLSVAGVVIAMLVIVGGGALIGKLNSNGPTASAGASSGDSGIAIGATDAPHTVVIYEDFICPYCGELEKVSHEKLQQLADDGKVRVEYRPFQLLDIDYSPMALQVFGAVRSLGDDEVTLKFHDLLYANQPSEEGPFPSEDDVIALAVQAGADETAVRGALDAGKTWADQATKDAEAAGVRSTPTVLLDGSEFSGTTVDDTADKLIKAVS